MLFYMVTSWDGSTEDSLEADAAPAPWPTCTGGYWYIIYERVDVFLT